MGPAVPASGYPVGSRWCSRRCQAFCDGDSAGPGDQRSHRRRRRRCSADFCGGAATNTYTTLAGFTNLFATSYRQPPGVTLSDRAGLRMPARAIPAPHDASTRRRASKTRARAIRRRCEQDGAPTPRCDADADSDGTLTSPTCDVEGRPHRLRRRRRSTPERTPADRRAARTQCPSPATSSRRCRRRRLRRRRFLRRFRTACNELASQPATLNGKLGCTVEQRRRPQEARRSPGPRSPSASFVARRTPAD